MRFTKETVRKVADMASDFTGNAFHMDGVGQDLGNGVRYLDGTSQTVWLGPSGARSACAYYIGVMLGWARATHTHIKCADVEFLRAVQEGYRNREDHRSWEERGNQDGQSKGALI